MRNYSETQLIVPDVLHLEGQGVYVCGCLDPDLLAPDQMGQS